MMMKMKNNERKVQLEIKDEVLCISYPDTQIEALDVSNQALGNLKESKLMLEIEVLPGSSETLVHLFILTVPVRIFQRNKMNKIDR